MPRNASGTYTLPESAFVAGTTIRSSPVNNDLNDISTALTQSLATTGVSIMTGPIKTASGTVTAPGFTWASAQTTGFYLSGTDEFAWTAAGVLQATFGSTGTVTWVGGATFGGNVTVNGTFTTGATTFVSGSEPVLTVRNSDNDTSEHELIRYALGSGAGTTASRRLLGTGANNVTQIRDYIGTAEIFRIQATGVNVGGGGVIFIATAGYVDIPEIAAPASPAANVARLQALDDGSGRTIMSYTDSAGAVTQLLPGQIVQRVYSESTTNSTITAQIPLDATIPQITEGTEIITASITPRKTGNRIRVRFSGSLNLEITTEAVTVALFRDAVADALDAKSLGIPGAGGTVLDDRDRIFPTILEFEHSPATVSSVTYRIRLGQSTAASGVTINEFYGGVSRVVLILEEINMP